MGKRSSDEQQLIEIFLEQKIPYKNSFQNTSKKLRNAPEDALRENSPDMRIFSRSF